MVDEQPQLHDLTKFLLDRLKTYPEEFVHSNGDPIKGKWFGVLDRAQQFAAPQDKEALNTALTGIIMNNTFQQALKVLLAPEEPANIPVGQSSGSSGVQGHPGGQFGGNGGNGGSGGPGLTYQQSQAAIAQQQAMYQQTVKNLVSQAKEQQKPTVTIPTSLAKAAGLKPMTTKEQIEHWKKRLGL